MDNFRQVFDGLLFLQYRSGNKKALNELAKRYHDKMLAKAYWYSKDEDVSFDIVQETWKKVLTRSHQLKDPNKFGAWVLQIVARKSIDYLKKNRREREEIKKVQLTNSSQQSAETDPRLPKLGDAIFKLPEEQQMVLRLFYREAYSIKEISSMLEISPGTVKSRLYHAREKLRTLLKQENNG